MAMELDQVIAKHIESRGGQEAWEAVQSMKMTGSYTAFSQVSDFTLYRKRDNKYLLDFVKTLRNWFKQILNYFDKRITNGFVEGMNRAIRLVISRAFGYRNFDNFKLQILAQHGPPL